MARETRDIAYPIAFIGFILLVMTILVIDPDRMNGLTLAKYFWFYSTLLLTGVITFGLAFYSMSIASIDITKSIMIGILTVVIIDICTPFPWVRTLSKEVPTNILRHLFPPL